MRSVSNKCYIPQQRYKPLSPVKKQKGIVQAFPQLFLNKEELIWLPVTMVWQELNCWIWVLSYPRGTRQKSSWLTSTVLELFIFCMGLSRYQFYSIQMHALFSDCPQPSPIGSAHLLLVGISLFWLLFLSKKKSACISQAVTTSESASYQWLPWQDLRAVFCRLTLWYHFMSRSTGWKKRTFLSNTNLQSYELLFSNHRAPDIFLWCALSLSVYSFQSGAQCAAQVYTLITQQD